MNSFENFNLIINQLLDQFHIRYINSVSILLLFTHDDCRSSAIFPYAGQNIAQHIRRLKPQFPKQFFHQYKFVNTEIIINKEIRIVDVFLNDITLDFLLGA